MVFSINGLWAFRGLDIYRLTTSNNAELRELENDTFLNVARACSRFRAASATCCSLDVIEQVRHRSAAVADLAATTQQCQATAGTVIGFTPPTSSTTTGLVLRKRQLAPHPLLRPQAGAGRLGAGMVANLWVDAQSSGPAEYSASLRWHSLNVPTGLVGAGSFRSTLPRRSSLDSVTPTGDDSAACQKTPDE